MMSLRVSRTQVRGANFVDEILDGISKLLPLLYRTGCRGRCAVFCLRCDASAVDPVIRIVLALGLARVSGWGGEFRCPLVPRSVGAGSVPSSAVSAKGTRSSSRK